MRKLIALTLAALLAMTALCGCNILEMGTAPTLPRIHYDESALTGKVEFVNGRTCRISILEGDGHYDAATEKREADVIFVTYASLDGSKSVQVGNTVTFTYSYTSDVTERDGTPHISVRVLTVK
ncbi:MAG: hypothetical protein IJX04_03675 [Oscillospiraceae bacterium]|nr:hypothetical protein [Oscillospiraceae bacterium]